MTSTREARMHECDYGVRVCVRARARARARVRVYLSMGGDGDGMEGNERRIEMGSESGGTKRKVPVTLHTRRGSLVIEVKIHIIEDTHQKSRVSTHRASNRASESEAKASTLCHWGAARYAAMSILPACTWVCESYTRAWMDVC